jgi:hypothetical protein
MNLQKHVNERTVNLLKSAQAMEENNKRALINSIVQKANAEIEIVSTFYSISH